MISGFKQSLIAIKYSCKNLVLYVQQFWMSKMNVYSFVSRWNLFELLIAMFRLQYCQYSSGDEVDCLRVAICSMLVRCYWCISIQGRSQDFFRGTHVFPNSVGRNYPPPPFHLRWLNTLFLYLCVIHSYFQTTGSWVAKLGKMQAQLKKIIF